MAPKLKTMMRKPSASLDEQDAEADIPDEQAEGAQTRGAGKGRDAAAEALNKKIRAFQKANTGKEPNFKALKEFFFEKQEVSALWNKLTCARTKSTMGAQGA